MEKGSSQEKDDEEHLEEKADILRQEAQTRLQEARAMLLEAKHDLDSVTSETPAMKRNPFDRTTASLRQMAIDLKANPTPILAKPSREELPDQEDEYGKRA